MEQLMIRAIKEFKAANPQADVRTVSVVAFNGRASDNIVCTHAYFAIYYEQDGVFDSKTMEVRA